MLPCHGRDHEFESRIHRNGPIGKGIYRFSSKEDFQVRVLMGLHGSKYAGVMEW